jgi:hypothetical protein
MQPTKKRVYLNWLRIIYFRTITRPAKHKNIVDLIDKLEKPKIAVNKDLKKAFYEDQAGKYGF